MHRRFLLALPFVFALSYAGSCLKVESPTESNSCSPPTAVGATVTSLGCSPLGAGFQCRGAYSVPEEGTARVVWAFTGGSPADSSARRGEALWTLGGLPQSVQWQATRCSCGVAEDSRGDSCASVTGSLTFVAAGP